MSELQDVFNQRASGLACSLIYELRDLVGTYKGVGGLPVDLEVGGLVVVGMVKEDVVLDEDAEGGSESSEWNMSELVKIDQRETAMFGKGGEGLLGRVSV